MSSNRRRSISAGSRSAILGFVSKAAASLLVFALVPGEVRAESLEEKVRAAFAEHAPALQARIEGRDELRLGVGEGEWAVYLDNLRTSCETRPSDCDSAIDNFVRRIATTTREGDTARLPKDKVFPVLRNEGQLRSMQQLAENKPGQELAGQAIVPGIALLYVVDLPDSFRFVLKRDLEDSGLSPEQLHEAAAANVATLEGLAVERLEGTRNLFAVIAHDGLGSSRLFDKGFWTELEREAGGPVAVAAPTRDWILAARLDDRPALAELRALAGRIVDGEPYAVSATLFRRDGASWREVQP